jgi:hypothetical protein
LWASGRYDLGLSDAQFWELTLREHIALMGRRRAAETEQDRRAALVAAVIANCHRNPDKRPEPFTEADFMSGGGRPQRAKIYTVSAEDQLEMARRDTEIIRQVRAQGRR